MRGGEVGTPAREPGLGGGGSSAGPRDKATVFECVCVLAHCPVW